MKLFFLSLTLAFLALPAFAQDQGSEYKYFRPFDVDFTSGVSIRSPGEETLDKSSLNLEIRNIGLVVSENYESGHGTSIGKFRIEIDMYGGARSNEGSSIDLRSFSIGILHAVFSKPNAILGISIRFVDFAYEKLDEEVALNNFNIVGVGFHFKPLNRTKSPVKILLTGEVNLATPGYFGETVNKDAAKKEKMNLAMQGVPNTDWEKKVRDGYYEWSEQVNSVIGARISFKERVEVDMRSYTWVVNPVYNEDQIKGVTVENYYKPEDISKYQLRGPTDGTRWLRRQIEVRIPIYKNSVSLVAKHTSDRIENRLMMNLPNCTPATCDVGGESGANLLVPFEVRKNKSTFVGVRVRF